MHLLLLFLLFLQIRNGDGSVREATGTETGKSYVYTLDGHYESKSCNTFKYEMDAYIQGNTYGGKFKSLEEMGKSGCMHPVTESGVAISPLAYNYTNGLAGFYTDPKWSGYTCKSCAEVWDDPCRSQLRSKLVEIFDAQKVDAIVHLTFNQPPVTVGSNDPVGNGACAYSAFFPRAIVWQRHCCMHCRPRTCTAFAPLTLLKNGSSLTPAHLPALHSELQPEPLFRRSCHHRAGRLGLGQHQQLLPRLHRRCARGPAVHLPPL